MAGAAQVNSLAALAGEWPDDAGPKHADGGGGTSPHTDERGKLPSAAGRHRIFGGLEQNNTNKRNLTI